MIKSNIFILTIAFSITFLSVSAQEQKKDPELEVNKLRNEIRKEIKDSLKNAQPTLKTTNNNGIRRDKLNINYQVNEIILSNDSIVMNEIRALGTAIEIPEVDGEIVKKAWIKKIKRKTKSKVNSTNEGISIKSTLIGRISSVPINIYSTVYDTDNGVKIVAAFEEEGTIISQNATEGKYDETKKFLRDFGVAQYKSVIKSQVKKESKELKSMDSKLKKLQKENEKMHITISSQKQGIQNTESDIEQNLLDQKAVLTEIQNKKLEITSLKGDAKKSASDELKDIKKRRKSLQKDHKSMLKKIVQYRAKIERVNGNVALNLSVQDLQKAKLSEQLSKVKSLEEKMKNIK